MTKPAPRIETDVLIVGSGPSGATTSCLLASYGIDNVMINKYRSTSPTPRAHITNQRAMEVLRDLGLEEQAKRVSVPQNMMAEHVYGTTLAGEELGRILTWYNHPTYKANHDLASPCAVCDIPQTEMEPLLVQAAQDRGAALRNETEYRSLEQDADGVTATVHDKLTGTDYQIRAKYLIAADGARSKVVKDVGLPLEGQMRLGGSINIVFDADLSRYTAHRPGDMYWMLQPGVGMGGSGIGVLRMVRPWDKWVCVWGYDVKQGPPELTEELGVSIVHRIVGDDSIDVRIDNLATWTTNDVHALQYTAGRVFGMGDAVHRHPPMNGLGSNTCMRDAHNLAWKLALVLEGKADPKLLDTYNDERQPVGRQIVKRANKSMGLVPPILHALGLTSTPEAGQMAKNVAARKNDTPDAEKQRAEVRDAIEGSRICFNGIGVELNQRYESAAIVPDGTSVPEFERDKELFHQASSRPGAHVPHVWLTKDQHKVATMDLCGRGRFTLLTGIAGTGWKKASAEVGKTFDVDIPVHVIGPGQEYEDIYGDYARACETSESGALLVRPDLFVGWRADRFSATATTELHNAMARILGHRT